ncbi:low molecular weight protein arginine phosphatase [Paenibacillus sp. NEAU-GSW1]|uniref:low molecular weight protein arginine phosphatase n=1 Tax=Paenibacillus sp. NEAU-GSW1 TaxID=2682486 RepID=UPI0012E2F21A|nr:low molecular weight protein arginine phosphatase [Paenibacillus sp. NEAU-GSW1]MUT65100.1 low molecular weight protein arginine phosphatase [Paenibacillus sp. NEAU-GSW1]
MTRILFVCTGNTCRSPMAEAMLKDMAQREGLRIEVRSAGVSTIDGLAISGHAAQTLREKRVEHHGASRSISGEAVDWADLILTMTSGHKRGLLQWYPEAVDKTHTLKEFAHQNESAVADIEELERLYSEMHLKQALGQKLTAEERAKLLELESRIPSMDIVDPFGGTLDMYRSCANEIEVGLQKLLEKLKNSETHY